jgi:hypothetical protein
MPEYDIVGTSVPLGKKVTDPPTHNAPKPTAQLVGDNVPLGRTPVYPPTHTLHQGAVQEVGDKVPLTRQRSPEWAQKNIPMSTLATEPAGRDK